MTTDSPVQLPRVIIKPVHCITWEAAVTSPIAYVCKTDQACDLQRVKR